MAAKILLRRRWADWSGRGLQHLVLSAAGDGLIAEAMVVGDDEGRAFGARFAIRCDKDWRAREVVVELAGGGRVALESDGHGHWTRAGESVPELVGAIDVDLPMTPFTNTLPLRRLGLAEGQTADIKVVYITAPDLAVTVDPQRYSCIKPGRLYHYESLDSDFERDITVDDDLTVVTYPGLFRRVAIPGEA